MKKIVNGYILIDENNEPVDFQIHRRKYASNYIKRTYPKGVLYGDKYIPDTKKLKSVPCTITYSPNKKVK